MNNGDYIWFKTDNKNLFEFSLNSFAQEGYKMENITFDLHATNFEGNVVTEYEKRFIDLGQPIYRVEAVYLGWKDERAVPEAKREVDTDLEDTDDLDEIDD